MTIPVALGFAAIFGALAGYTTWLYAKVWEERREDRRHFARVVGELRSDIQYLAERAGVDLSYDEAPTEKLPAVKPADEAPARKVSVLARYTHEGQHRQWRE